MTAHRGHEERHRSLPSDPGDHAVDHGRQVGDATGADGDRHLAAGIEDDPTVGQRAAGLGGDVLQPGLVEPHPHAMEPGLRHARLAYTSFQA